MYHVNSYIPDRQGVELQSLRERSGLSLSEIIRRLIDYGLQERVLNEIVPSMSGSFTKGLKLYNPEI